MSLLLLLTWSSECECTRPWTSIRISCFSKANLNSHSKLEEYNSIRNMILSKTDGKSIFRNLHYIPMNKLLRNISPMY